MPDDTLPDWLRELPPAPEQMPITLLLPVAISTALEVEAIRRMTSRDTLIIHFLTYGLIAAGAIEGIGS
jgi:hypothetical protein